MNPTHILLLAPIAVFLCACISPPLKVSRDRDRLSRALDLEPNSIRLLNYCFFDEIYEWDTDRIKGKKGFVTLTNSELCFTQGKAKKTSKGNVTRIPIHEIEGVHLSEGQLQLKLGEKRFVFYLYGWNDLEPDYKRSMEFYHELILADVPRFEASTLYSWTRGPGKATSPFVEESHPSDTLDTEDFDKSYDRNSAVQ